VKSVNWLFSATLKEGGGREKRDRLLYFLGKKNIESRPFFFPIHKMPPYKAAESFPNAEHLADNGLSLPSFLGVTEREIVKICDLIKSELR
ncbi:MAG: DegT/DnrJ/EryC1/StrS family aminotransferase, partial [Nitrospinota bacterium]